jgi:hypothetical protein
MPYSSKFPNRYSVSPDADYEIERIHDILRQGRGQSWLKLILEIEMQPRGAKVVRAVACERGFKRIMNRHPGFLISPSPWTWKRRLNTSRLTVRDVSRQRICRKFTPPTHNSVWTEPKTRPIALRCAYFTGTTASRPGERCERL